MPSRVDRRSGPVLSPFDLLEPRLGGPRGRRVVVVGAGVPSARLRDLMLRPASPRRRPRRAGAAACARARGFCSWPPRRPPLLRVLPGLPRLCGPPPLRQRAPRPRARPPRRPPASGARRRPVSVAALLNSSRLFFGLSSSFSRPAPFYVVLRLQLFSARAPAPRVRRCASRSAFSRAAASAASRCSCSRCSRASCRVLLLLPVALGAQVRFRALLGQTLLLLEARLLEARLLGGATRRPPRSRAYAPRRLLLLCSTRRSARSFSFHARFDFFRCLIPRAEPHARPSRLVPPRVSRGDPFFAQRDALRLASASASWRNFFAFASFVCTLLGGDLVARFLASARHARARILARPRPSALPSARRVAPAAASASSSRLRFAASSSARLLAAAASSARLRAAASCSALMRAFSPPRPRQLPSSSPARQQHPAHASFREGFGPSGCFFGALTSRFLLGFQLTPPSRAARRPPEP